MYSANNFQDGFNESEENDQRTNFLSTIKAFDGNNNVNRKTYQEKQKFKTLNMWEPTLVHQQRNETEAALLTVENLIRMDSFIDAPFFDRDSTKLMVSSTLPLVTAQNALH